MPALPGRVVWLLALTVGGAVVFAQTGARVLDSTHDSAVFGEERNYRVFLPADYDQAPQKRDPVIYFFHGWSERHNRPPNTGRGYDTGDDYRGDNIASFVGSHDVIVVKWDGFNPRKPGEDYVRPYNIPPETHRQFPFYFPELVEHIDATFRTIPDREHRATAGLSTGDAAGHRHARLHQVVSPADACDLGLHEAAPSARSASTTTGARAISWRATGSSAAWWPAVRPEPTASRWSRMTSSATRPARRSTGRSASRTGRAVTVVRPPLSGQPERQHQPARLARRDR